ncbi:FAD-binding oxidoreductase [Subtercola sp. RTI3]|uniref:FAD-binding oxidoreductase n=1 Tax=Subtercola sp. RTI3 TaxID=3048639 RepID=UPI002B222691|nr:FAD-linked oxidase C-terminal domain-containing protein [Subtercola sp. RTI3]MEA9984997.1 FAD-linked oxidase C-terminal domain-containing protein [Subtercola sp. RTI3]
MTTSTAVLHRLRAELGSRLSTDPAELQGARADRSGYTAPGMPLAIVRAESIADVQAVMRIATEWRVPVVPQGAATGLAGGGAGSDGAIVLSTASMNRILEVALADELAVVEPGVINQALSDAVAQYGLVFSPDPASKAISTIGGNIATNAGGLLCAKYGVTREAVLGLTVVLPDGRMLETGHRSIKGVTGYDLTALFTGSEGTLGVIVGATVRLRPIAAGTVVTIGAFFDTIVAAAAASAAVTAARLRPAVMELIDHEALKAIDAFNGTTLSASGGAYLLVQTDGGASVDEADRILAIVTGAGGTAELTIDPEVGERLLAVRRSVHPSLAARGEVLIEDVCVPRSQLAAMFGEIERIGAKWGLSIPTVAHAGDGNLHPNFVITPELALASGEVPDVVWQAAGELFRAALDLGGTLTGEHGIGVLKKRWLRDEVGTDSFDLQRQIKAVFDPLGIMNPGTMF